MEHTNANSAAFPCEHYLDQSGQWLHEFDPGLSKREYFAAMALQGLLARNSGEEEMDIGTLGYPVYYAVRAADLLLSMLKEMQ